VRAALQQHLSKERCPGPLQDAKQVTTLVQHAQLGQSARHHSSTVTNNTTCLIAYTENRAIARNTEPAFPVPTCAERRKEQVNGRAFTDPESAFRANKWF